MDEALRDEGGKPAPGSGGSQPGGPVPISDRAREQINEGIDKTREQLDAGIEKSAEELRDAAERLRIAADDIARVQRGLGNRVAGELESAAGYLRVHPSGAIIRDMRSYLNEHRKQAAVGAVFAGLILRRAMHHKEHGQKKAA